jgi:hypothetical protein
MDKSVKLEGLKSLRSMVKDIVFEMMEERSKGEKMETSPEHEAEESPEQEALEHATGLEVQEKGKEEAEESDDDVESSSPFRSEKERLQSNMYRGGKYAGMFGGSPGEEESSRSSGRGKPFPKRG